MINEAEHQPAILICRQSQNAFLGLSFPLESGDLFTYALVFERMLLGCVCIEIHLTCVPTPVQQPVTVLDDFVSLSFLSFFFYFSASLLFFSFLFFFNTFCQNGDV